MKHGQMIDGTPNLNMVVNESGHVVWCDSYVSHATPSGATRSAMSATTFSNATVHISRATLCGVTQLLVASQNLAQPKGFLEI
jgi:hypothetical protein